MPKCLKDIFKSCPCGEGEESKLFLQKKFLQSALPSGTAVYPKSVIPFLIFLQNRHVFFLFLCIHQLNPMIKKQKRVSHGAYFTINGVLASRFFQQYGGLPAGSGNCN